MSHPINTVNSEHYQYIMWERAKKNNIINMTDPVKKQVAWNKVFPTYILTDDYLSGSIY